MGRTLYICENDKVVATVDGPSIWIERPMKAGQRVPIRLVSRVFLVGEVKISSEAILTLAEHNIPLIVCRMSGEDKAVLLPFNHKLPRYFKEQRIILESKQNIMKYMNWVETYRNYFQIQVLKKYFPNLKRKNELGESDYKLLLTKLVPKNKALCMPVKQAVNYLIRGLLIENVNKAKLDLHLGVYFRRVNFGFVLDLSYLLEPKADEQVILFFKQPNYGRFFEQNNGKMTLTKEGHRNIVHRFENKREELETEIGRVIDDFFHLIREMQT